MNKEEDLLESLLAVASEELEKLGDNGATKSTEKTTQSKIIKEIDIFECSTNVPSNKQFISDISSVVHSGDTDSSDDEGNRNYEDLKYNEYGRNIKKNLNSTSNNGISSSHYGIPKKRVSTLNNQIKKNDDQPKKVVASSQKSHQDVFFDPIFSIRIVNPLISSATLTEKMQGRVAVQFADLVRFIAMDDLKDKDWVLCGVLVAKSPPKTSQKGTQFSIWTLSDLKNDIKTVGLFMFSGAHADLWKTTIGTVIGVLNPSVMERRSGSKDIASLNVDTAQKVMIFGHSKDFGICKSTKKNGEKCTSIVNLSQCEFCVYHIKQEYQKCSKRSELQSNFAGKGLVNLRNKVLGKNEVFYAGKSYVAIPAKKSRKLAAKDDRIMQNLNGLTVNPVKSVSTAKKPQKGLARQLDVNPAQRAKDLELLKKLGVTTDIENKCNFSGSRSDEVSLKDSKAMALDVIKKLKTKNCSENNNKECSKYDIKGDLFKNVDCKNNFSGEMSASVSLDQSKVAALNVISKLKRKPLNTENCENNSEELDLKYSDEEGDVQLAKISSQETENDEIVSKNNTPLSKTKANLIGSGNKCTIKSPALRSTDSKINTPAQLQSSLSNKHSEVSSWKNNVSADMGVPKLSTFGRNNVIDLNKPIATRHVNRAKMNALHFIQKNGPIKKIDPNSTKTSGAKKRQLDDLNTEDIINNPAKKSKLQESEFISDRFKKMMAMTSRHSELIEQHDNEEKEKYFRKQEVKEQMEEKMVNTFKVKCKAVKCLQCKYTSFSASDLCKAEKHPLKVFDSMKRFYKCSNCQNRTVTLELLPTRPCTNCGSTNWEKTGMMKEKIIGVQHKLSIRGGEQDFVNSVVKDANLDLLVPDD